MGRGRGNLCDKNHSNYGKSQLLVSVDSQRKVAMAVDLGSLCLNCVKWENRKVSAIMCVYVFNSFHKRWVCLKVSNLTLRKELGGFFFLCTGNSEASSQYGVHFSLNMPASLHSVADQLFVVHCPLHPVQPQLTLCASFSRSKVIKVRKINVKGKDCIWIWKF